MKIRNGFVSNSSSSSFVLIAPLKAHQEAMGLLSKDDARMMKVVGGDTKMVGNEQVILITGDSNEDSSYIGDMDVEQFAEDEKYDDEWWEFDTSFFDRYIELLPKDKIVYIMDSDIQKQKEWDEFVDKEHEYWQDFGDYEGYGYED
jgi:hypothetical protein